MAKLNPEQSQLFIGWAIQFVKRKCVNAPIIIDACDQTELGLEWEHKQQRYRCAWKITEQEEAYEKGPDALRGLIRDRICKALASAPKEEDTSDRQHEHSE